MCGLNGELKSFAICCADLRDSHSALEYSLSPQKEETPPPAESSWLLTNPLGDMGNGVFRCSVGGGVSIRALLSPLHSSVSFKTLELGEVAEVVAVAVAAARKEAEAVGVIDFLRSASPSKGDSKGIVASIVSTYFDGSVVNSR